MGANSGSREPSPSGLGHSGFDPGRIGANGQVVKLLEIGRRVVEVDAEIAPLVTALNAAGMRTRASCSGHGFRPGNIILDDGREIIIARDHAEARRIGRLFPLDINGERIPCDPMDPDEEGWSEWLHPMPGFMMQCCDCGLVHELQVAITHAHEAVSATNEGEDAEHAVVFRMRRPASAGEAGTATTVQQDERDG